MTRPIPFLLSLLLLLGATVSAPIARANDADVRIPLTGTPSFPTAKGNAKYRDRGGERQFQVEAENLRRLAGQQVGLILNGTVIGAMRVTSLGTARYSVNTSLRQSVPVIVPGTVVEVRTGSGAVIVRGRF